MQRAICLAVLALSCVGVLAAGEAARRDAHGDPLPEGAVARLGWSRLWGRGTMQKLEYTPDGKHLVGLANERGRMFWVQVWQASDGQLVAEWPIERMRLGDMVVADDGKSVVTVGYQVGATRWELTTGKKLGELDLGDSQARTASRGGAPDRLVVAANTAAIVDIRTGEKIHDLGRSPSMASSPDGKLVALTGIFQGSSRKQGPALAISDTQTGKRISTPGNTKSRFTSPCFSRDGKRVAVVEPPYRGGLPTVQVFEVASGKRVHHYQGKEGYAVDLIFGPEGKFLYGSERTGKVFRLDLTNGKREEVLSLGNSQRIPLALSPDGKTLAIGSHYGCVIRWDVDAKRLVRPERGHLAGVTSAAISADGKAAATSDLAGRVLKWDLASGKLQGEVNQGEHPVRSVRFTTEGSVLVAELGQPVRAIPRQGKALASYGQADLLTHWMWQGGEPARLVLVGHLGQSGVYEWPSGKLLRQTSRGSRPLSAAAVSPAGRWLITGSSPFAVQLWDVASLEPVAHWSRPQLNRSGRGRTVQPRAMSISRAGDMVVLGMHGQFVISEVTTGKTVRTISLDEEAGDSEVCSFSPDGRVMIVAGAGHSLLAIDTVTGEILAKHKAHRAVVTDLTWSRDGEWLVSASHDGTALVWPGELFRPADLPLPAVDRAGRLGTTQPTTQPGQRSATTQPAPPSKLADLWDRLGSPDAAKAWHASWAMIERPGQAAKWIATHLRPDAEPQAPRVRELIRQLGAPSYATRRQASDSLASMGSGISGLLRKALQDAPNEEARTRLANILSDLNSPSPASQDGLRRMRAIHVLERIGSAEARAHLGCLAEGNPSGPVTVQARYALARLSRFDAAPPAGDAPERP